MGTVTVAAVQATPEFLDRDATVQKVVRLTKEAAGMEDDRYPYSWLPPEDASAEAAELATRGPEAFPD